MNYSRELKRGLLVTWISTMAVCKTGVFLCHRCLACRPKYFKYLTLNEDMVLEWFLLFGLVVLQACDIRPCVTVCSRL
uniref:Uncharacterized protein n=1 Tax=Anguilla anguilla TaxID=7936 RepID=A0A0E9QZI6_ANGAN